MTKIRFHLIFVFLFWFLLSKDNYFHWDEWQFFAHFQNLPNYLLHLPNEQFMPINMLHHFTLFEIFGLNYLPFQLSVILFHVLNCFLLYKIVSRETKNEFLATAALVLFGISALHNEVVNYSLGITVVMAGTFFFLGYFFFTKYESTKKSRWLAFSALSLIISPLSHDITLLAPFAFLPLAWLVFLIWLLWRFSLAPVLSSVILKIR